MPAKETATTAPWQVCEAVDCYDDMYPEFAPDPIEVPCTYRATQWFVVRSYNPCTERVEEERISVCDAHADPMHVASPMDTVVAYGAIEEEGR